jgi:Gpi18-like mannosyltransferase
MRSAGDALTKARESAYQRSAALLRWARTREGARFFALLGAALLLRLAIAPLTLFTLDLRVYVTWGEYLLHHPLHPYSFGGAGPDWYYVPDYPPLAMYTFGALDGVYVGVTQLFGLHPVVDPAISAPLRLVFKLPAILADLGMSTFIYALARRVMSPTRALLVSATYAFTPGILIVTLLWGQIDGVVVLCVALSLYCAWQGKGTAAGILFAMAVGFKPQPLIFLPLLLVWLYHRVGWREALRAAAGLAGASLLLWLPYLLPPHFEVLAYSHNLARVLRAEYPSASHGALSAWYLINAQTTLVSQRLVGPFTLQMVSTAAFAGILLLVLVGAWRERSARVLWSGAAILALGMFDVGTLQFERYLTPAVALFLLAALYDRRYWVCYASVSVMLYLNFAGGIVGCQCYPPVVAAPHWLAHLLTLDLNPKLGALVNVLTLALALLWYFVPGPLVLRRQVASREAVHAR